MKQQKNPNNPSKTNSCIYAKWLTHLDKVNTDRILIEKKLDFFFPNGHLRGRIPLKYNVQFLLEDELAESEIKGRPGY